MKTLTAASILALALAFTGCTRENPESTTDLVRDDRNVAPAPLPNDAAVTPDTTSLGDSRMDSSSMPSTSAPSMNENTYPGDRSNTTGASRDSMRDEKMAPNSTNSLSEKNRKKGQPVVVTPGSENPER